MRRRGARSGSLLPFFPLQPAWVGRHRRRRRRRRPRRSGARLIVAVHATASSASSTLTTGAPVSREPPRPTSRRRRRRRSRPGHRRPWSTPSTPPTARRSGRRRCPPPPRSRRSARGGWAFVRARRRQHRRPADATPAKPVWTVTPGGAVGAPLVVEGDRLYAATRRSGPGARASPTAQAALAGDARRDVTALTAVEGHVFAATAGRWLVALDARKGEVRWRYRIGGAAIGLAVDEDRVDRGDARPVGAGLQDRQRRPGVARRSCRSGRRRARSSPAAASSSPASRRRMRVLDRRTGADVGLYTVPMPAGRPSRSRRSPSGPVRLAGRDPFDDVGRADHAARAAARRAAHLRSARDAGHGAGPGRRSRRRSRRRAGCRRPSLPRRRPHAAGGSGAVDAGEPLRRPPTPPAGTPPRTPPAPPAR